MTGKNKKTVTVIVAVTVAIALVVAGTILAQFTFLSSRDYDISDDIESVAGNERILRVAADADHAPYSYFDKDGKPAGYDVELIYALARKLGCNVSLTLCDWDESLEGLTTGRFDVVTGANFSASTSDDYRYSLTVCNDTYVFFGLRSDIGTLEQSDYRELRIAVTDNGNEYENIALPLGIADNVTQYHSVEQAFRAVRNGECDVVLVNFTSGSYATKNYGFRDMTHLDDSLAQIEYCLLTGRDNEALSSQLDGAISALQIDGTLEKIELRWLNDYRKPVDLASFFSRYFIVILYFALGLITLTLLIVFLLGQRHNVRERRLLETDSVTGLPKMETFCRRVDELLRHGPDGELVLVRYDIDHFTLFNNTYGLRSGDMLLRSMGASIRAGFAGTKYNFVGYVGGDGFVSCHLASDVDPSRLYRSILDMLDSVVPGYSFSVSLGLCHVEQGAVDIATYCNYALMALNVAKLNSDVHWAWYDDSMRLALIEEREITSGMRHSLEAGEFIPYFQPQFNCIDNTVCGAEALVRWKHPTRGFISPAVFIPFFEKNGFIYELDKVLWDNVCACIRRWRDGGIKVPPISVNISRRDIYHSDLAETLCQTLERHQLSPSDLVLELTESAYVDAPEMLTAALESLKAAGFSVDMDDFGSGYSSLSVLNELPFDRIKLDMQFLANRALPAKTGQILSSVVRMAHLIGLDVIAEGVETQEQADFLKSIGCECMQGYLYSKPLPEEQFVDLLTNSATHVITRRRIADADDADAFFEATTQQSLLFNRFVGGACIVEYRADRLTILRFNDQCLTELGISAERLNAIRENVLENVNPTRQKLIADMLDDAISTEDESNCEITLQEPNGPQQRIRCRARCLAQKNDSYLLFLSVENVTPITRIESALGNDGSKPDFAYKDLMSSLGNVYPLIIVCNPTQNTFRIVECEGHTNRFTHRTGKYDELVRRTLEIIPYEADREKFGESFSRESILQAWKSGERMVTLEHRLLDDDGNEHWMETTFLRVVAPSSRDLTHLALSHCIDTRKRNEAMLSRHRDGTAVISVSETERVISGALESNHDWICRYDIEARTFIVPRDYAVRHGCSEYMADYPYSYSGDIDGSVDPHTVSEQRRLFADVCRGVPSGNTELCCHLRTGETVWEHIDFVCIFDAGGKPVRAVLAISDVTEAHKNDSAGTADVAARSVSAEQLQSIIELGRRTHPNIWSVSFSREGKIVGVCWGREIRKMLGLSEKDTSPAVFDTLCERIHPDDRSTMFDVLNLIRSTLSDTVIKGSDYRIKTFDRGYRWFHATGYVTRRDDGTPLLYVGVLTDVTEERQLRDALRNEREHYRDAMSVAGIGIWHLELVADKPPRLFTDSTMNRILAIPENISPEGCYLFWLSHVAQEDADIVAKDLQQLRRGIHQERIYRWEHAERGTIYVRSGGAAGANSEDKHEQYSGYCQVVHDSVLREKQMNRKLQQTLENYRQADLDKRHDFLTGLYNRRDLQELLDSSLIDTRRQIKAVFMMDIDNYKSFNDRYGHVIGDDCLRRIGQALSRYAKANNMRFYRYGGEELLGISFNARKSPSRIADELLTLISELDIPRDDVPGGHVTVSIGYTANNRDPQSMIELADAACYRAKERGKNVVVGDDEAGE